MNCEGVENSLVKKQIKIDKEAALLLLLIHFFMILAISVIYNYIPINILYLHLLIIGSLFFMPFIIKSVSLQFTFYYFIFISLFAIVFLLSIPFTYPLMVFTWNIKKVFLLTPVYFILIMETRHVSYRLTITFYEILKDLYNTLLRSVVDVCLVIFKHAMNLLTNYFLFHIFIAVIGYIYKLIYGNSIFGYNIDEVKSNISSILVTVAILHFVTISLYYTNLKNLYKIIIIVLFLMVMLKIFIRGLPS